MKWPGTQGIPYAYPQAPEFGSNKNRGDIIIGNDVWIGYGVKLFKGITLGNGAVIGACSLVNKSIEPYTIAAGIPARPIRKRFTADEIAILEQIKWWDWPADLINRYMPYLCSSRIAELQAALEPDAAFQQFQNKGRAEEFLAQADAAYARNDLNAACDFLKQALACSPESTEFLVCLGNVQFQLERHGEALESFKRASELKPNDSDILVRLAKAAVRCNASELFERALAQTLKINPKNPHALRLAANRDFENGCFTEAARQFCSLLPENPRDLLLLLQLGKCLRAFRDFASARWCYERALEIDPANAIAREVLAGLDTQPEGPASRRSQPSACLISAPHPI